MKLITRDTDYAVRILCYLSGKNERTAVVEMVRELKIPAAFLRRIAQRLSKAGILTSAKGFNGGFTLSAKPRDIRLLDVAEIFQGNFSLNDCLFKRRICPDRKTCFLRRQILDIEKYVLEKFASLTVGDILAGGSIDGQKKNNQDRRE